MKDKEELLKAIEQKWQEIRPTDTGEMKPATVPNNLELGWLNALEWMKKHINSLPAEEEQLSKEDLEEASQEHVKKLYGENWMDFVYTQEAAFRAEFSFKSGSNWQKEQMLKSAVSIGYLQDWYQNSIDGEVPPIWTDEHFNELTKDFYIIPKQKEDEQ